MFLRRLLATAFALMMTLGSAALAGSPTANKGYTKPTPGADINTWGPELNTDLDLIDANVSGLVTVPITTTPQAATVLQAQSLIQKLTGTLTANSVYQLPTVQGFYIIDNETSGAFTLQVSTAAVSANAVTVRQGKKALVYCDGANVFFATNPDDGLGFDQNDAIVASTGTSGHYTVTLPSPPPAYQPGMFFLFRADHDSTGNDDINFNVAGVYTPAGVRRLLKPTSGGPAIIGAGDIKAGQLIGVSFDPTLASGAGGFSVLLGLVPPTQTPFSGGFLTQTTTMQGAAFNQGQAPNIVTTGASGQTLAIGAATGNFIVVTGGGGTVSNFDTAPAGTVRTLSFQVQITLNASANLITIGPGVFGPNFVTQIGDFAQFTSLGNGAWTMSQYTVGPGTVLLSSLTSCANLLAGSDTIGVVTPALLACNGNIQTNGLYKFAGGLIFNWGIVSVGGSATTALSFATPFPNAAFNCQVTSNLAASGGLLAVSALSRTSVSITNYGTTTANPYLFCIGN